MPSPDVFDSIIRLCALLGYVSMVTAAIMTPFAVQLYQLFKKNFIKMHHAFALSGLILITLHPVIFAITVLNILVFVPVIDDWVLFWELAGRPALILIYIGVIAGFLRNKVKKYWKMIHALLYIALFFGLVHGTLIGTSFQNILIIILYYTLFIMVILGFSYKRYQVYQRKKKIAEKSSQ
jgi:DMSO/TMAO reductase YedYZ heme-binding membrane subunit